MSAHRRYGAHPTDGGQALSHEARRAWVLLRNQGGLWTAQEVARELLEDDGRIAAGIAGKWLASLVARDHAVKNTARMPTRYGVTTRCVPIPGETLEPAL